MKDDECVSFLQWALPRLQRRWPGFRKVRRTTCKRIDRRIEGLGLPDVGAYRELLMREPREWQALEALLPITISRFYRDTAVFDFIGDVVLKELASQAGSRGALEVQAWSIGCASGEEPYSLKLLWRLRAAPALARPAPALHILATDIDADVLERARRGCYAGSSLKLLPDGWLEQAFTQEGGGWRLRDEYRSGIDFARQDVCAELPAQAFDLILCRNLVFTYFDAALQAEALRRILTRLRPGGAFVIGRGETLPPDTCGLAAWSQQLGVYRLPAS